MKVRVQSNSVLSGKRDEVLDADSKSPWNIAIVAAFLADDDIAEMTIVSPNIGFVKTFIKVREPTPCD